MIFIHLRLHLTFATISNMYLYTHINTNKLDENEIEVEIEKKIEENASH